MKKTKTCAGADEDNILGKGDKQYDLFGISLDIVFQVCNHLTDLVITHESFLSSEFSETIRSYFINSKQVL